MSEQQAAREKGESGREARKEKQESVCVRVRGGGRERPKPRQEEKKNLKIKNQSHSVTFFSNLAASGRVPCATLAASSETRRDARGVPITTKIRRRVPSDLTYMQADTRIKGRSTREEDEGRQKRGHSAVPHELNTGSRGARSARTEPSCSSWLLVQGGVQSCKASAVVVNPP